MTSLEQPIRYKTAPGILCGI